MERAPALAPSPRFAAVLQVAEDPLEPRRETPHQRGLQLQLLGRRGPGGGAARRAGVAAGPEAGRGSVGGRGGGVVHTETCRKKIIAKNEEKFPCS